MHYEIKNIQGERGIVGQALYRDGELVKTADSMITRSMEEYPAIKGIRLCSHNRYILDVKGGKSELYSSDDKLTAKAKIIREESDGSYYIFDRVKSYVLKLRK